MMSKNGMDCLNKSVETDCSPNSRPENRKSWRPPQYLLLCKLQVCDYCDGSSPFNGGDLKMRSHGQTLQPESYCI